MSTQALYSESKALAEDLYALLRTLDPSTWRIELEDAVREQLRHISERARRILEAAERLEADTKLSTLLQRLQNLAKFVRSSVPSPGLPAKQVRREWRTFWRGAQPMYEAIAASLTLENIKLPTLRPSNYARNVFHVLSGIVALLMIQYVLTPKMMIVISGAFALFAWTCETVRRFSPGINRGLMWFFGPMAHPHEHFRVNSATWYATALLVIALMAPPLACSLAVIVLALGDPAAALIGRKFGRIRLHNGRSLEGSLAFIVAGGMASLLVLSVYYPELSMATATALAFAAAVPAAIAELLSKRIDDNFTIPVSAAAGASALLFFVLY